ncbi:hypothetical protein [Streptomyces sulphureus]|uniref:hypothetical protein n=1 Tax=Streptomyces sulphureus TaxID=47758 RepID=UPI0003A0E942|nr:hypothetical protein [Streptomyces sulphureus]
MAPSRRTAGAEDLRRTPAAGERPDSLLGCTGGGRAAAPAPSGAGVLPLRGAETDVPLDHTALVPDVMQAAIGP